MLLTLHTASSHSATWVQRVIGYINFCRCPWPCEVRSSSRQSLFSFCMGFFLGFLGSALWFSRPRFHTVSRVFSAVAFWFLSRSGRCFCRFSLFFSRPWPRVFSTVVLLPTALGFSVFFLFRLTYLLVSPSRGFLFFFHRLFVSFPSYVPALYRGFGSFTEYDGCGPSGQCFLLPMYLRLFERRLFRLPRGSISLNQYMLIAA